MLKIFFPALGVGFSELRQIAMTFCHSIVNEFCCGYSPGKPFAARSFAHATDCHFCFRSGIERSQRSESVV